jgi:acetoin utilization deacetylase AcuC-like enzyme
MTSGVQLFHHPACEEHDPGPEHPECTRRLPALLAALGADRELAGRVALRLAAPAAEQDLLRVHTPAHLERLRAAARLAAQRGAQVWVDEDTAVSARSWDAALAAAGCAMQAAEAVASGAAPAAFALSRPPGHHASAERAMGFCLVNNVAVAVRLLQARGAAERVLVVDWDAHHGNGTEDVFREDPSVFVLSLHASPHFPGTGGTADVGAGRGRGTTLNVPLPHGTGGAEYRARFLDALDGALAAFSPDLAVVSVGLDALEGDPEGGLRLAPEDFHALTRALADRLPPRAGRRVVGVLEGGYAVEEIGRGFVAVLRAMAGLPPP